ncbi:MAG TPA: peptidoglycan-binding protein [Pyrinomonadaceae bacterium]|jgi:peptidoglycan hydrolase-like protein with peptidoglycan-binding domain|nr:peptidoglycan-binding protein [Pyrinomonadaceae bacterium]
MVNLVNVPGIENTSEAFRNKVIEIADRLLIDPNFLMAIMSFESGATFSPKIKSPVSSATGLIQFMAATAIHLGTTTAALAAMTAIDQLDFVEKYFLPFRGRLLTIEDAYMAVLFPKGIGKGRDFVLFEVGSKAYKANKPLDFNADGKITVGEAAKKVAERLGTPSVNNVVELKKGDHGPAVESLQDELIDLGYLTPEQKKTGAGIFGPKTETALKAFQKGISLKDTGVLDLPTQVAMRQLNDGVEKGSSGGIVQVLQAALVAKKFLSQADMDTGTGIFGPKTQAALIQFQIKNSLEPNGTLTDETYRLLFKTPAPVVAVSVAPVGNGIDVVLPMRGDGFQTYNREPNGADQVGTAMTINAIIALAQAWFLLHPEILLQIGDISRRGGGNFPPHASHKLGKDFDVRPLRKDNRMDPITISEVAYDTVRTEEAIRLVLSRHPNATIFFNDARLINKNLTKHAAGHHNHFHVRIP